MKTVTITQCYDDRAEFTSRHREDSQHDAIAKAVRKAYGRNAYLYEDHGLNQEAPANVRYGQIGKANGSQITGRVRIEVDDD